MNITVPSYVSAPLILAAMFVLCLLLSAGLRTIYITVKSFFLNKTAKKPPAPPPKQPKPAAKPKTLKSIEINPDDVDRIYVRKSS